MFTATMSQSSGVVVVQEVPHPSFNLKLLSGLPLIFTAAVAFLNNSLTQIMNFSLMYMTFMIWKRKCYDTLSYALKKLIFDKTDGCLACLAQYNHSWIKIMLSNMKRSGKNTVCTGLITSLSMS